MTAIEARPAIVGEDLRWTAFRVLSQREKFCAEALGRRGFSMFYPTELKRFRVSRHAKRTVLREVPLIPGYLFFGSAGEPPLYELAKLSTSSLASSHLADASRGLIQKAWRA